MAALRQRLLSGIAGQLGRPHGVVGRVVAILLNRGNRWSRGGPQPHIVGLKGTDSGTHTQFTCPTTNLRHQLRMLVADQPRITGGRGSVACVLKAVMNLPVRVWPA